MKFIYSLTGKVQKEEKKQRVEDTKDLSNKDKTDLPNKVRKDSNLEKLVKDALNQLDKARQQGHNGYSGN